MAMSPSTLTMRRAVPSDAAAVVRLVRSAYRGESSRAGWTTEADLLNDQRIDEAGVRAKIAQPGGVILLAFAPSSCGGGGGDGDGDDDGLPVACCEVLRYAEPSSTAYFGLFAVRPALQDGGIGRAVLAAAERVARAQLGARTMEMAVIGLRRELVAWYRRRGYVLAEGETRPFSAALLLNGSALRDDLYFVILRKELV